QSTFGLSSAAVGGGDFDDTDGTPFDDGSDAGSDFDDTDGGDDLGDNVPDSGDDDSGQSASGVRSGGAIFNVGSLVMANATVSGNAARIAGGGVASQGALRMVNSTITANQANVLDHNL